MRNETKSNQGDDPRQQAHQPVSAGVLQREGGLTVLAIDLVFPNGNERAIGEAEKTEQNQENTAVMEIHRHLHETEDRDARSEEQGDAKFLGHAQGVLPMKKLMRQQVNDNGPKQEQAGFKLGRF